LASVAVPQLVARPSALDHSGHLDHAGQHRAATHEEHHDATESSTDLPDFNPCRGRLRQYGLWAIAPSATSFRHARHGLPTRPALITPPYRLSYRELDQITTPPRRATSATPLRSGDRLMFSPATSPRPSSAYYGTVKAGMLPVCTLPMHVTARSAASLSTTGPSGTSCRSTSPRTCPPSRHVGLDVIVTLRVTGGAAPAIPSAAGSTLRSPRRRRRRHRAG